MQQDRGQFGKRSRGRAAAIAAALALAFVAGTYLWSWVNEAVFAAGAASAEVPSDQEALKKLDRLLADQEATLQTLAAIQQELRSIKLRVTH